MASRQTLRRNNELLTLSSWCVAGLVNLVHANSQRNSHIHGIIFVIPNQHLCAKGNVFKRSVVNVPIVLKCVEVLFVFVPRAANETHPTGCVFIASIDVM